MQYAALVIGTLGTVGWAVGGRYGGFATPLWCLSSLVWIFVGIRSGVHALSVRDTINVALYVYGVRAWFLSARPAACAPSPPEREQA